MKKTFLIAAIGAALMATTAISAEAKTTINLCTGGAGKPYSIAGQMIADQVRGDQNLEIKVITDTGGSWGNISKSFDKTSVEQCDAFISQPDGPVKLAREQPANAKRLVSVGKLHYEYLHALCGKDSGVDDIGDLESMDNASIAIGDVNSGAGLVWDNFVTEDDDYSKVATSPLSGIDAIAAVASGDVTCMLVPAGLGDATVREADELYGDQIVLVGVNDKDFNDSVNIKGEPLYDWADIPSGTYAKNLQGWFSSKETIRWRAEVYVNADRVTDAKAKSSLIRAVAKARAGIVQTFGGE